MGQEQGKWIKVLVYKSDIRVILSSIPGGDLESTDRLRGNNAKNN